jgi:hypothetical protein
MEIRDLGIVLVAAAVLYLAYYLARLARKLEHSAAIADEFLVTARRELESSLDQSRSLMKELGRTSEAATDTLRQVQAMTTGAHEQFKKVEKLVSISQAIVEGLKLNTLVVEKAIASPLAKAAGIVMGLSRGVEALKTSRKSKGDKS